MSSIADPQPDLPADDELVAYLDGELPPAECRRVEARLANDAAYRRQLRDLNRAWDALDVLPETKPDEDFARTTMELVAGDVERDLSQQSASQARSARRQTWWLAAAGIVATLVGFTVARAIQSRGDRALLADLPVIRQLEPLSHVESVDFLRHLPAAPPFTGRSADDPALHDELHLTERLDAPSPKARQEWIESISDNEKASLEAQVRRFRELPPHERDRLRLLHRAIQEADDSEILNRNLLLFGQWLAQLTPGEQEELRQMLWGVPPQEQRQRLERFVRRENRQAAQRLSSQDQENLRRAVAALVEERRENLSSEMRRRGAEERARRLEGPRGALMVLTWTMRNEEAANHAYHRLVNQLSPEARGHLERLGPRARWLQLWEWVREATQPKWTPGELERFFAENLDNGQRERLLGLPPGEMQSELEQLYLAGELGFRGMLDSAMPPWNAPNPDRPDMRGRPGGPPPRFDRGRFEREPGGPERRRPGDRDGRRPPPGPLPPPHERPDAI